MSANRTVEAIEKPDPREKFMDARLESLGLTDGKLDELSRTVPETTRALQTRRSPERPDSLVALTREAGLADIDSTDLERLSQTEKDKRWQDITRLAEETALNYRVLGGRLERRQA